MRKLILIAKVRPSARAEFAQKTHLIGGLPRGAAKPRFSLSENTRRWMILYQRDRAVRCSRSFPSSPQPSSLSCSPYLFLSCPLFHFFILSSPLSLSTPLTPCSLFLFSSRYLSANFARSIGRAFPCIFKAHVLYL